MHMQQVAELAVRHVDEVVDGSGVRVELCSC
jgi:hypothetical protein